MNANQVNELQRFSHTLQNLGFSDESSLEQLVFVAQVAGQELAHYLGISITELRQHMNTASISASSIPIAALNLISHSTYSLGVSLEQVPAAPRNAPSLPLPAMAPPPSTINHISDLPEIRDQGNRGTCVAHAALAVYEHRLATHAVYQDMSEQFLYWNCKHNDGYSGEGTWLEIAMPLLERDGCCLEITWNYNPEPIAGNEGQAPPPAGARVEALNYRSPKPKQIAPTSVDDIKHELTAGHCVAFSIPVFNSWYGSKWVAYTGDITMPIPNEICIGGHAMCIVGYVDRPNPGFGGGRFIIRNSWDRSWGITSPYGSGYGTIPYAYLERMGVEAYTIE